MLYMLHILHKHWESESGDNVKWKMSKVVDEVPHIEVFSWQIQLFPSEKFQNKLKYWEKYNISASFIPVNWKILGLLFKVMEIMSEPIIKTPIY